MFKKIGPKRASINSLAIGKLPRQLNFNPTQLNVARSQSSLKSWIPTEPTELQKVTTQAIIHELTVEQQQSTAEGKLKFLDVNVEVANDTCYYSCSLVS